jgi:hypothetical protein
MAKSADLIGKAFGKLLVVEKGTPIKTRTRTYVSWRCRCSCGNEIETKTNLLLSGKTKSCGCLKKEITPKIDLSSFRFGNLVVNSPISRTKHGRILWECKCDCGNIKHVTSSDLKAGKILSCGCLWRDRISITGVDHFRWNPELSSIERENNRRYPEYIEWRQKVFERDHYSCQICDKTGNIINAHHIENYAKNLEKRVCLSNGITLCRRCHLDFHHQYGYFNNNLMQLKEFKEYKSRGD